MTFQLKFDHWPMGCYSKSNQVNNFDWQVLKWITMIWSWCKLSVYGPTLGVSAINRHHRLLANLSKSCSEHESSSFETSQDIFLSFLLQTIHSHKHCIPTMTRSTWQQELEAWLESPDRFCNSVHLGGETGVQFEWVVFLPDVAYISQYFAT